MMRRARLAWPPSPIQPPALEDSPPRQQPSGARYAVAASPAAAPFLASSFCLRGLADSRGSESNGLVSVICASSHGLGPAPPLLRSLRHALGARPPALFHGSHAVRTGSVSRKRPQALTRTDGDRRLLLVDCTRIRVPGDAKVLMWPASVFVADVAFAHVARHDEDFLGRVKQP
jgi:hypothetical protein